MKKTFFFVLLALLTACNQTTKPDPVQAEKAKKLAGKYMGTTPCADCEGIEYALTLNPDFTYTGSLTYLGKSTAPFALAGKWAYTADNKINLEVAPPEGMNQFETGENQLTLLDQQGGKITGELADKYILYKEGFAPKPSPFEKKKSAGIDFIGMGNEPSWSLDIDFDKSMKFKVLGSDSINTPPVTAKNWKDGTLVYEAKTEAGALSVTIVKQSCSDGMSDNTYDYSVSVKTGDKEYKGCGHYLAGSLGSLWTLKTVNGVPADPNAYMKGLPVLQIQTAESRYFGTDGCNNINGKVTFDGAKVTFAPGISTKMACPGNAPDDYIKILLGATEYKLTGSELTLLTGGKPVLVYGL